LGNGARPRRGRRGRVIATGGVEQLGEELGSVGEELDPHEWAEVGQRGEQPAGLAVPGRTGRVLVEVLGVLEQGADPLGDEEGGLDDLAGVVRPLPRVVWADPHDGSEDDGRAEAAGPVERADEVVSLDDAGLGLLGEGADAEVPGAYAVGQVAHGGHHESA
jgi:hypothetical protein